MGRREADPHVGVDEWNLVQQVGEARASLAGPVHSAEATAKLGRLWPTELLLRCVPVAVHVLAQKRDLPDTLVV